MHPYSSKREEPTDPNDGALAASESLDDLRRRIDEIDRRLIAAISDRARVVEAIGKAKRAGGSPIYAPHREREVIDRVLALNHGPLSNRTIEAIYRELMSGSFALELPIRVGYLGPAGSFSHVAATRHFGSSVELADLHEIRHVFEEVAAGRCNYGLVPYENSTGGGITDTLDAFQEHDVRVYAESLIEVSQNLLANCAPGEIERIYSKPQVFTQCRQWLAKQYPDAELIAETSSAAAAIRAAGEPGAAAIGSLLAAQLYDVAPLFEGIQDYRNNITRFLVIAREEARPAGDDKTTLMFVTANKPGALVDVLNVFRDAGINLTHIDKRPSRRENWEYTFFIDCEAHRTQPVMMQALADAGRHCLSLKVLGSYPKAKQIL